ncbi:glycosyl hydrolase 115 family protein [Arachidicoccus soli]|uniref:Glycosyl hydrolase n=1 Tax=Arachidicoccus soli TaxID=2341117 RepID=A0A386HSP0_9BACT|nr:glycosyl hydrolase 115 family protein [Arachidicoccus soli]AYD48294.1 glycosyl hydrolase [Arachidicoccus soli]
MKKHFQKYIRFSFLIAIFAFSKRGHTQASNIQAKDFILSAQHNSAIIYVYKDEKPVVKIAANALAGDIQAITGIKPLVTSDPHKLSNSVVIIGTEANVLLQKIEQENNVYKSDTAWEHFTIRAFNHTGVSAIKQALIIRGSDARGAAFGAFTLSKKIGISPWIWWADVKPKRQKEITVPMNIDINQSPSVKFRGIFLNDEDWGLRPWASAGLDKSYKNIGPNTYAKIFELLLRLKANTIWPAMHPGTTPFFQIPENIKVAEQYDIYVGSSHAEPMLRNNVGEWNEKTMGAFNYVTNHDSIYNYWKARVKQTVKDNVIYTVGIRGVHDSRMEGAKTLNEKLALLTQVLKDQSHLLAKYVNKDLSEIPQVFVPYKEVLPIYNAGLKVPDYVTLMWPDDNYGYIRRLSNSNEQQRSGSGGIYYHLSYWGSPMDYLWLSTTNPALVFEEMRKAWDFGAKRMWIVNVGDLKPAEYDLQFFMDMAWNINSINPSTVQTHLLNWVENTFGKKNADAITKVIQAYYHLAFERRPEFLDWSSDAKNNDESKVHPFNTEKEILNRIDDYREIAKEAQEIKRNIPTNLQDAYFELVLYPVLAATYMNEKIMYAERNKTLAAYNLPEAGKYGALAENAYDSIIKITNYYNDSLANGKWKGIMSMAPRKLSVFDRPKLALIKETNTMHIQEKDSLIKSENKQQLNESKHIIINANQFTKANNSSQTYQWTSIQGLGYSSNATMLYPFPPVHNDVFSQSYLEYKFYVEKVGNARINICTVPTFPVYQKADVRVGISLDNTAIQEKSFATREWDNTWKNNVIRNQAYCVFKFFKLVKGWHTMRLYALDPGVILDQIKIDFTPEK